MNRYTYMHGSSMGHLQRGVISDTSPALVDKLRSRLEEQDGGKLRPIAVNLTGERTEVHGLTGGSLPVQAIEWSLLARRDDTHWDLDVDIEVASSEADLTQREGANIDRREAERWQVVGHSRFVNSATPEPQSPDYVIEGVTIYTRPGK